MSKTIYLLRHAQAVSSQGSSDQERALAEQGRQDALALGLLMKKKAYIPAMALCSSSVRTKETLQAIDQALNISDKKYLDSFYAASPGTLFAGLQNLDNAVTSAVIVAHNPGIHELAMRLSADDNSAHINKVMGIYRPATLSVIETNVENWADLQLGEGRLIDLLDPMDYNAPARPTRWM